MNNNTTLFGGREVVAQFIPTPGTEPGKDAVRVRQLSLRDYERAFALIDDEIALAAFICGKDKKWADELLPESYEALYAAAREVNAAGFFAWSLRRRAQEQQVQDRAVAAMAGMSPEALKTAFEMGRSLLQTPSLRPPRPRE